MRIVHNDEVCEVSADDFWSLRMDTGFDRFIAEGDKQIWSLLSEAEEPAGADGAVAMRRHTKLNFKENPVPSWLRGALGGGSDFSFKVTAHFYPTLYDEAHPYAYSTAFPVLADAISVVGKQWALAAGPNRCRLVSRVEVSVALTGLGGSIEKLIERGVKDAYKALPRRAEKYLAQRGPRPPPSLPDPPPPSKRPAPDAAVRRAGRARRRRAGRRRVPAALARDRRRRRRRPAAAGRGTILARAPPDVGGGVGQAAAGGGPSRHRRRTDARCRLRRRRVAAAADGDAAARALPSVEPPRLPLYSRVAEPVRRVRRLSRRRLPLSVLRRGGRGVGGGRAAAGVARAGEQPARVAAGGRSGTGPARAARGRAGAEGQTGTPR